GWVGTLSLFIFARPTSPYSRVGRARFLARVPPLFSISNVLKPLKFQEQPYNTDRGRETVSFCRVSHEDGMSMAPAVIRIGAVNSLNTKPLIHDLEQLAPEAELVLDLPSRLADDLEQGRLDVALIPVIEYFRHGSYSVVPNIAIASNGPVLSVTLFSRMPWAS